MWMLEVSSCVYSKQWFCEGLLSKEFGTNCSGSQNMETTRFLEYYVIFFTFLFLAVVNLGGV